MADTPTDTTTTTTKPRAKATKRAPAVTARERAKAVMAAKRAAQLERERKLEDALATVLAGADTEAAAAAKRDQAITAAHTAYEQAVTDIAARSATALRIMRELDEPVSVIADMTGLTRARIAELLKHTDPKPANNGDGDAGEKDAATPAS
jgi:hypothetical protein